MAALALAVAVPLLATGAGLIVLDGLLCRRDRGPVLYRERRLSAGRELDLLKLRVLRTEAIEEALLAFGQVRPAESDLANLTWAGRLLKRFYLDELPQLWNVLRGDMSLVGPRPWPPRMVEEQERLGLCYRRLVPAGLTGPAQVRKGVPGVRFADLDLAYVEACRAWSSWRLVRYDLGILLETVRLLARGQGLWL